MPPPGCTCKEGASNVIPHTFNRPAAHSISPALQGNRHGLERDARRGLRRLDARSGVAFGGAGEARAERHRVAPVLCAGGTAGVACGGQLSTPPRPCRPAIRCSTTRSSAASSACRMAAAAASCSARSAPACWWTPPACVVTNVHVIEGADEIKVSLADKREFEATVVLKDPRSDLAILAAARLAREVSVPGIRQFRRAGSRRHRARHRQSLRASARL